MPSSPGGSRCFGGEVGNEVKEAANHFPSLAPDQKCKDNIIYQP